MTVYDGPLESTGADPRLYMEFEVAYQWPEAGRCSVGTCGVWTDQLTLTRTKHYRKGKGNEEGAMYFRCPDHQTKYEKKVRDGMDRRMASAGRRRGRR